MIQRDIPLIAVKQDDMKISEAATKTRIVFLRDQALRCRRLAISVNDLKAGSNLIVMAQQYEEEAKDLSLR
jgi:hypothetical protein